MTPTIKGYPAYRWRCPCGHLTPWIRGVPDGCPCCGRGVWVTFAEWRKLTELDPVHECPSHAGSPEPPRRRR